MKTRAKSRPVHLLRKSLGARRNVDYQYCLFLSQEMLYPGDRFRVADGLLETYIRQVLDAFPSPDVNLTWFNGEPTLLGLDFFKRYVMYAERHCKPGQRILHTLHTDGALLNDEWCTFFKEQQFFISLTVDGPRKMHDVYGSCAGQFDELTRACDLLNGQGVDFSILCNVHAANADHPIEVYRFFRDSLKARFVQFIPLVEPETAGADEPVTGRSVGAEQFGRFLIAIFDEWVRRDVGRVFVHQFDAALGNWLGEEMLSVFAPGNNQSVQPGYRLENLDQRRMAGPSSRTELNHALKHCQQCSSSSSCVRAPGLNYLCSGYKIFFEHIDFGMKTMASLLRHGRCAEELMLIYANGGSQPCPCRSGKKFKHCHGLTEGSQSTRGPVANWVERVSNAIKTLERHCWPASSPSEAWAGYVAARK